MKVADEKLKCCRVQRNFSVEIKNSPRKLLVQSGGLNKHEPRDLPPYLPFGSRDDRCYIEQIELNIVARHNSHMKLDQAGVECIRLSIKPNNFNGVLQLS